MPKSKKLKEQEELVEILKFIPVTVNVHIWGYGGESYIGKVSREDYEFFKSKKIDIEQFASSWDEDEMWNDVPSKHRFIEPGSPYECDHYFHESGATMDSSSHIQIEDANGNLIWESTMEPADLEDSGAEVECVNEFISSDLEDGSVVFWGGQGEKGTFFHGELVLRSPFDPSKLKVSYSDGDGWYLSGGVEYDGVEIDGTGGYSTTGKWAEHKFWIVGDEEVYAGVERDDDWDPAEELDKIRVEVLENEEAWAQRAINSVVSFTEEQKTDWHADTVDPVHEGTYEVFIDAPWPNDGPGVAEWRDSNWYNEDQVVAIHKWRGLKENPSAR